MLLFRIQFQCYVPLGVYVFGYWMWRRDRRKKCAPNGELLLLQHTYKFILGNAIELYSLFISHFVSFSFSYDAWSYGSNAYVWLYVGFHHRSSDESTSNNSSTSLSTYRPLFARFMYAYHTKTLTVLCTHIHCVRAHTHKIGIGIGKYRHLDIVWRSREHITATKQKRNRKMLIFSFRFVSFCFRNSIEKWKSILGETQSQHRFIPLCTYAFFFTFGTFLFVLGEKNSHRHRQKILMHSIGSICDRVTHIPMQNQTIEIEKNMRKGKEMWIGVLGRIFASYSPFLDAFHLWAFFRLVG